MFAEVGLVIRNCSVILRMVTWFRFTGEQRANREDFQLDIDFDEMEALRSDDNCGRVEEVSIVMVGVDDDDECLSDANDKKRRPNNTVALAKMASASQLVDL